MDDFNDGWRQAREEIENADSTILWSIQKEPTSMEPKLFYIAVLDRNELKYKWLAKGLNRKEDIVVIMQKALELGYAESEIKTCFVEFLSQALDEMTRWNMDLLNSTIPGGMAAKKPEDGRRLEMERGQGGDHDSTYKFKFPLAPDEVKTWFELRRKVEAGLES